MHKSKSGFTIVELLIVIVVIGILATITIVAYNGIQARALNARRVADMNTITTALELYRAREGQYPNENATISGGWESSAVEPEDFLLALKTSGIIATVPVDPINTADNGSASIYQETVSYIYHLYPAGYGECDASRGPLYVLAIHAPGSDIESSPGVACSTYSGSSSWVWSTGKFSN